ncbi:hypothetical protein DFP72DRAFT_921366 [Ephemerocybe angulata]|uniref:Uncharacterized protein n=1 Tax=Ephemerocybe angulata TaxID=980116 RepID=A0A8H6LXW4_9AGAR|nr:hypothetical protein DFP72DRAFT_921366 [Tulosesus angulatus]
MHLGSITRGGANTMLSARSLSSAPGTLGRSVVLHSSTLPSRSIIQYPYPDPSAGAIRADSSGLLLTSKTSISGDASRYGMETKEYFHVDTEPNAVPYNLPGTNGANPRYGCIANPPIKDGIWRG